MKNNKGQLPIDLLPPGDANHSVLMKALKDEGNKHELIIHQQMGICSTFI